MSIVTKYSYLQAINGVVNDSESEAHVSGHQSQSSLQTFITPKLRVLFASK